MQGSIVSNFRIFLFLLISSVILVSCGGGGGSSSLPSSAVTDRTGPSVITTLPRSEQPGVLPVDPIKITFNESLSKKDIAENQVVVYQVDSTDAVIYPAIQLDKTKFRFETEINVDDVLVVPFVKTDDLKPSSQYRVTVKEVKDVAGNSMVGSCTWDFTTGENGKITKEINRGFTGLCGSLPSSNITPDKPQSVQAFPVNESTVYISWKAPAGAITANFYQIERLVDNQITIIKPDERGLTFTDTSAIANVGNSYKITAGNDAGLSGETALSNSVIPVINGGIVAKPSQVLESENPVVSIGFGFGHKLKMSPDGKMLAVANRGADTATAIEAGTVQLFNQSSNGRWQRIATLISSAPAVKNYFGRNIVFSPDSRTLAVWEYNEYTTGVAAAGTVQLFTRTDTGWNVNGVTLISSLPNKGNGFGGELVFTPDSATLAVGELYGDTVNTLNVGTVQLFSKTNSGSWDTTGITLVSDVPTTGNQFSYPKIAFSAKGETLAVSEVGNFFGAVHLFTKTTSGSWNTKSTVLKSTSSIPTIGSKFGSDFAFSPDGSTLAVGDYERTVLDSANTEITYAGAVQLYTRTATGAWNTQSPIVLKSNTPASQNAFGFRVSFSPDSSTLAVSELKGDTSIIQDAGAVYLYSRSSLGWRNRAVTLFSSEPVTGSAFGISLVFSPNSATLAVSEYFNTPTGTVQIFNKKSLTEWNATATALTSTTLTAQRGFGKNLLSNEKNVFSSDSKTITITEYSGSTTDVTNAGVVYLFSNTSIGWKLTATLNSNIPNGGNQFGVDIAINPDGKTLFVGELYGETSSVANAGVVNVFNLNNLAQ